MGRGKKMEKWQISFLFKNIYNYSIIKFSRLFLKTTFRLYHTNYYIHYYVCKNECKYICSKWRTVARCVIMFRRREHSSTMPNCPQVKITLCICTHDLGNLLLTIPALSKFIDICLCLCVLYISLSLGKQLPHWNSIDSLILIKHIISIDTSL